jgi:hypothetical protein
MALPYQSGDTSGVVQPGSAGRPPWAAWGAADGVALGLWLTLSVIMLAFVRVYGSRFPWYDDVRILTSWALTPAGDWGWFFQPFQGHVMPLGRMAMVGSWTLFDGDMRPVLFGSALLLVSATLWVLVESRRSHGALALDDCLVPLALLGTHAYADVIWGVMWINALAVSLTVMLSASMLRAGTDPGSERIACFAAVAGVLAFEGGLGLLAAAGFVPALAWLCWGALRRPHRHASTATLLVAVVTALIAGLLVYETMVIERWGPRSTGRISALTHLIGCAKAIANPIGSLVTRVWALGTAVVGGTVIAILAGAVRSRSPRALFGVLMLLPVLMVCAGLAIARGQSVGHRYIVMTVPIWVPIVWAMRSALPAWQRDAIRFVAVVSLAASFGYGIDPALNDGRARREATHELEKGIAAGHSFDRIAADCAHQWGRMGITSGFSDSLRAIAGLGKGALARIPPRPRLTFEPVSASPLGTANCEADGDWWEIVEGSVFFFDLGGRPCDAARIVFEVESGSWDVEVALGPGSRGAESWRAAAGQQRTIYPVMRDSGIGGGTMYEVTAAFDTSADAVVFAPPRQCRRLKIVSVESGLFEGMSLPGSSDR